MNINFSILVLVLFMSSSNVFARANNLNLIIELYSKISSCTLGQCSIEEFEIEKLDPTSEIAKEIIALLPQYFSSVVRDDKGNIRSYPSFDHDDPGRNTFPYWRVLNGEIYLYYGIEENGEWYNYANFYRFSKRPNKKSDLVLNNKSTANIYSDELNILKKLKIENSRINPNSLEVLGTVEMTEGGSYSYLLSDEENHLCAISEGSVDETFVRYCGPNTTY